MNQQNVPNLTTPQHVLNQLQSSMSMLSPELKKAAAYLMENTSMVGVSSARHIAREAGVKPNTVVRLAKELGFDGYEPLRAMFQTALIETSSGFQDRARWLQDLSRQGSLGQLYADLAGGTIRNIETTLSSSNENEMKAAAKLLHSARQRYMLGVGINHAIAESFCYLAGMAGLPIETIPRFGSLAIDDLAQAGPDDVMIAITFKPYRQEVVSAVAQARVQGVKIIGISDSPASPIILDADQSFIVDTDTPQFYTSIVATMALLETLMAFVIADADQSVIDEIEAFHDRRHQLGIYVDDNR